MDNEKKIFNKVLIGIAMIGAIIMIIPLLWMVSTSLRLSSEAYKLPPSIIPTQFHFENYLAVLKSDIPFLTLFVNSAKVTIIVVIAQLITSSTSAYAFARLKFPGRDLLFGILLVSMMIPIQVTIIPIYIGMSKIGLVDNHLSLILPSVVNSFGIFLLRQFFLTLPKELEDAGKIDGAGFWMIFWKIALPQAAASMTALIILTFNNTWNNYYQPLIFISTWDKMTITLGIAALRGYMGSGNLSVVLAGVTLAILPVLLIFLFGQKYIIEGMTSTGIKG